LSFEVFFVRVIENLNNTVKISVLEWNIICDVKFPSQNEIQLNYDHFEEFLKQNFGWFLEQKFWLRRKISWICEEKFCVSENFFLFSVWNFQSAWIYTDFGVNFLSKKDFWLDFGVFFWVFSQNSE
jgi:hypothetical protein